MKKILKAAVAVSGLAATPAMAQSTDYQVTGSVAAVCSIAGAGSAKIDFTNLTDATSGAWGPGVSAPSVNDTAAYCNQAATKVSVAHENLKIVGGATSNGFANEVVITPSILTPEHTAIVGDVSDVLLGAFTGLTVSATATNPGSPLLAGTYNGKITVTLAPAS